MKDTEIVENSRKGFAELHFNEMWANISISVEIHFELLCTFCSFAVWSAFSVTQAWATKVYGNILITVNWCVNCWCDYVTVCVNWFMVPDYKIQHTSCKISAHFGTVYVCVLVYAFVCLSQSDRCPTKDFALQPVITSSNRWQSQFVWKTAHWHKNWSVSTYCYHPGLSTITELLQSDNVALTHLWTIYPLPHCFGAISQKRNMIVCTWWMSRQSFPNKTQTLSTAGESAENQHTLRHL